MTSWRGIHSAGRWVLPLRGTRCRALAPKLIGRAVTPLIAMFLSITLHAAAQAGARPSLFRGVVVADSPVGVRVVSLEESAQAYQTDLRPDDVIARINDTDIRSIDEFAAVSASLKGASEAALVVFRNGQPRQIRVHLFSVPVQQAWGIDIIPEDIRFAQPETGLAYWTRLGRGFEQAGKTAEALDAYLNGLHNMPDDLAIALRVETLLLRVSREQLSAGELAGGVRQLRQSLTVMERLFERPLDAAQLDQLRSELKDTLEALRAARLKSRHLSRILNS